MARMYQRILAAVDGSPESRLALDQAIMLAKAGGGQLRLVCVVDEYSFDEREWVTPSSHRTNVEEKRAAARRIVDEARQLARDASVEASSDVLELGWPRITVSAAIRAAAVAWPADLVVLGTHGRKGWDRIVLGSVAEGVARINEAPVLLVRAPVTGAGVSR
jgi:nucleotide-binding universal stress UspA family protein